MLLHLHAAVKFYIFLFTQKSTMAVTCLSSAYLGATTFFKKPQSLLWMTQCLLISFFWSKTITAWGYLTYLSNLTSFNNNNKAVRINFFIVFFSECNAYLELIIGCTTQVSWNDNGLLYGGRSWVQTPGRLPTCVLLLRSRWVWFEILSHLRRASC